MVYTVVVAVVQLIVRVVFRVRVVGADHVPASGAAILCSNHVHWLDPFMFGAAAPRRLRFMSKKELFVCFPLRWILRALGAFPVDRGAADRSAVRQSLDLLDRGQVLGMFPEGTRSRDGVLGAGETGVAVIALRSGAPVVPMAIVSQPQNYRLRSQVTVRFGEKIIVRRQPGQSRSAAARAATNDIMASIAELVNQGQATLTDAGREEA